MGLSWNRTSAAAVALARLHARHGLRPTAGRLLALAGTKHGHDEPCPSVMAGSLMTRGSGGAGSIRVESPGFK